MKDQAKYWIAVSEEDLASAKWLIRGNRFLHAAFFCHQVVEKALKAVIARDLPADEMPPRIHSLINLASAASLLDELSDEQKLLLQRLNPLSSDTRYPDYDYDQGTLSIPKKEICDRVIIEVEEFLCWIKRRL